MSTLIEAHALTSWSVFVSAVNGQADADKAAEVGKHHVVTWLSVSFNGVATNFVEVRILENTPGPIVEKFKFYLGNDVPSQRAFFSFPKGILIANGKNIRATLPAGGTGITGLVGMGGYTI